MTKCKKKCKDNENNTNNKNNRTVHYFDQYVLNSNNINTLFKGLNMFLINVECYKSDINRNIHTFISLKDFFIQKKYLFLSLLTSTP